MKKQNAHFNYSSIVFFFSYYFAYLKESNWKLVVKCFLNTFSYYICPPNAHTYSFYKLFIIYKKKKKKNRIKKTTQIILSSIVAGAIAFSAVFFLFVIRHPYAMRTKAMFMFRIGFVWRIVYASWFNWAIYSSCVATHVWSSLVAVNSIVLCSCLTDEINSELTLNLLSWFFSDL